MAACGSLQHIFDKPLPENQPLLESLSSWNQIKPLKSMDQSSFTEIFGELHFKDDSQSSSSSPLPPSSSSFILSSSSSTSSPSSFLDLSPQTGITKIDRNESWDSKTQSILEESVSTTTKHRYTCSRKNGDSFSRMNHESLQLCTEGLGFESSDDVEDLKDGINEDWPYREEKMAITRHSTSETLGGESIRKPRLGGGTFPPPISCIGKSGKPQVSFRSYRHDGRFVLEEVRIPTLEFLHACREDGRLKLQFVHQNDEVLDDAKGEEEVEESFADDVQEEYEEEKGNRDDDDG